MTTKGHDAFTPEGDCLEVCVLETGEGKPKGPGGRRGRISFPFAAGSMSYEPAEGAHMQRATEGGAEGTKRKSHSSITVSLRVLAKPSAVFSAMFWTCVHREPISRCDFLHASSVG